MAEVIGVASGIIELVSVSLEVTKRLLDFYAAWKDQDNDVSRMCRSLDNLRKLLDLLMSKTQPSAKFDSEAKKCVENCIGTVRSPMERLQAELQRIRTAEGLPAKDRARFNTIRRHVQRALYPFRAETLQTIEASISEAVSNLGLALQVLQIDAISSANQKVDSIVRWKQDEETREIIDWLSPVNFWLIHEDVRKQRETGTAEWLLQEPEFLDWEMGDKDTIWCHGSPGVGKTVLSSVVIDFLEQDLPVPHIGLAFIYCNHKEYQSQNLEYFLRVIIRQLVEQRMSIPENICSLYRQHRGKRTAATKEECLWMLQSLSKDSTEVYVVIDALDECIDKENRHFWSDLLEQLRESVAHIRLLCTSRDIEDSKRILQDASRLEIRAKDADIEIYIRERVRSLDRLVTFCRQDPDLQGRVMREIRSKSDGMFLSAKFHVESLGMERNLRGVRRALERLPRSLDDLYHSTMERIKGLPDTELAFQVISWIVYSSRPLRFKELQHAIAIDSLEQEDSSIPDECLTPQDIIINACAGLVKINEETSAIGLVHYTAQEYFDRYGSVYFPHAQRNLELACIRYLSLGTFTGSCPTDELYERRLAENPFLVYAAQNLGEHSRPDIRDQYMKYTLLQLLFDDKKMSCISQVLFVSRSEWTYSSYSQKFPRDFLGIHYAAYCGMVGYFLSLLQSLDPDSKDDHDRTPLLWAAEKGHEAVVKLLLLGGADANSRDNRGRTPLFQAAKNGHESIVKLLLARKDVNPDTKDDKYGQTPLSRAAEDGREAIVKMLLARDDVDPNSKDDGGKTALSWASTWGHEAVVKLLLTRDTIDAGTKDTAGNTPLALATRRGHESVVRLLSSREFQSTSSE